MSDSQAEIPEFVPTIPCTLTHYSFKDTKFPKVLKGEWHPHNLANQIKEHKKKYENKNSDPPKDQSEPEKPFDPFKLREIGNLMMEEFAGYKNALPWEHTFSFEAKDYANDGVSREIKVYYAKPKETKRVPGELYPALVYFHGGGMLFGKAEFDRMAMQKFADDNDIIAFSVEYRLIPETPAPGNIMDGYAALKYIITNAAEFNVDPKRVATSGDSAGGYMSMGVGWLLAKNNETDLVKFVLGHASHLRLPTHQLDKEKFKNCEVDFRGCLRMSNMLAGSEDYEGPLEDIIDRVDVFITNMSEEHLKKFPKTVLATSEFDFCRFDSEVFAEKLEKHGRLLDYIVYPGWAHNMYIDFVEEVHPARAEPWDDLQTIFKNNL